MNILAFDTSTDALSVALAYGDEVLVDHQIAPQQHAMLLLPSVEKMLAEAGLGMTALDGIVYGRGPGSFTGVRIAAAVAQGLAMGAGLGVYGISSLHATAQACHERTGAARVVAVFDARMQEVYWVATVRMESTGLMQPLAGERVLAPLVSTEAVCETRSPSTALQEAAVDVSAKATAAVTVAGSGVEPYAEVWPQVLGDAVILCPDAVPHAAALITLGKHGVAEHDWQPVESATPTYLRNRVALTEAQRAAGGRL